MTTTSTHTPDTGTTDTLRQGMLRTEAVTALARHRGDGLTIVTMQATAPWVAERQHDGRNLNLLGSMGSASAIGLGLAMARRNDRVMVLDGDGSLLMQLATLVSIADVGPRNLYHVVFENGTYETSGRQPVPGSTVSDLCEIALGAGYRRAVRCTTVAEMDAELPGTLAEPGPTLISLVISGQGEFDLPDDVEQPPPFGPQVHQLRERLAADGGASQ